MFTGVWPKSQDFFCKKAGPGKTEHNNNILVKTTEAFASHVFFGVIFSPNGYTLDKDGEQILEFETQL